MPPTEFITWCIDVLASRYGWTRTFCLERMYWEEFWEHVVVAANFTAEEKNAEFRFQFMLHATKKDVPNWKDLPVPFPPDKTKSAQRVRDMSGISQLPANLQGVVYRPDAVVR